MEKAKQETSKEERAMYRKTINKAYYESHKEERKAYRKAYNESHKEELRAYYESHKEERKAYHKAYTESHKEERKAYHKAYTESHKEERKAYHKAYTESHKEERKAYIESHKEELKAYRESHKEELNAYSEAYNLLKHPDRVIQGSEEHRQKASAISQGIPLSEWEGFTTENPYCKKFNNACRERNREKYGRVCFVCGKNESENSKRLSVHHVSKNKNEGCDGSKWQLIPLCSSCHGSAHNEPMESRIKYLLGLVWN